MITKDEFESILAQQAKGPQVPQVTTPGNVVAATSTLDNLLDQEVTVRGVARDAAMGAVVVRDGGGEPIYVAGLREWPPAASGKRVEVKGTLRRKKIAPDAGVGADGGVSHGMGGAVLVLENPTWTVS